MLTLKILGDQPLDVRQPARRIAHRSGGPRIAPSVAIDVPVHRRQHRLASGISDALERTGALGLAVFVVADAGRHLGLTIAVDRLAGDMGIDGVETLAHHLAALHQIEVSVIADDIRKALVPLCFFESAHLFAVDFADNGGRLVGVVRCRLDLAQGAGHDNRQQLVAQAVLVVRPALLGHPRQVAGAVPFVDAVAVEAGIRTRNRPVAAHDVTVGMR